MRIILCTICLVIMISCSNKNKDSQGGWIKGTEEERIKTIEKHFRGFDNAMVETGYRYQELYWAGQDANWEYASYQLEKIELAIRNGLERRPLRAESAKPFLELILPEIKNTIKKKDAAAFNQSFNILTSNCNSCHKKEKLLFFFVKTPTQRQSPIKK